MSFKLLVFICLQLTACIFGRSPRIVGGEDADITEFPFMASLRSVESGRHYCGAAIVSNSKLITAAHCFSNREHGELRVFVGSSNSSDPQALYYEIESVLVHPEFSGLMNLEEKLKHDIAVITIVGCFFFNDSIKKIRLPVANVQPDDIGILLGWGKKHFNDEVPSQQLQKSYVRVLLNSVCAESLPFYLHFQQLCTYHSVGVGACIGDSGGPIVHNGILVGISSFIQPCALGYPDISTRIFRYIDFIKDALAQPRKVLSCCTS